MNENSGEITVKLKSSELPEGTKIETIPPSDKGMRAKNRFKYPEKDINRQSCDPEFSPDDVESSDFYLPDHEDKE